MKQAPISFEEGVRPFVRKASSKYAVIARVCVRACVLAIRVMVIIEHMMYS